MAREAGTVSNVVNVSVPGQPVVVPVIIPSGELGLDSETFTLRVREKTWKGGK